MSTFTPFKIGQHRFEKGCFTEEFCIRGLTLEGIRKELGLPERRMKKGAYISFAIQLPSYHEFHLGGWAKYATNNFIKYSKRSGKMKWNEDDFEKTYDEKRVPITIEKAKKAWLKGMRYHKLIKVLPVISHEDRDEYPKGGLASQIIVAHPIRCQVVKFMPYNGRDIFHDVWS